MNQYLLNFNIFLETTMIQDNKPTLIKALCFDKLSLISNFFKKAYNIQQSRLGTMFQLTDRMPSSYCLSRPVQKAPIMWSGEELKLLQEQLSSKSAFDSKGF